MIKIIRILEVPIYLLVIAVGCYESGSDKIGTVLVILSILRLWINHITDENVYKSKGE